MDRYHLEIYSVEEKSCALRAFSSDQPFLPISNGEFLDPGSWGTGYQAGDKWYRVQGVRHIVFDDGDVPVHKICLYVAMVDSNAGALELG